ncbi:hypothetical protein C8R42DRAFT_654457 [Lentinula raphanica]|nr:hypothetical protein C8R42DRAFT_654457 [Lentinula raphanica]
MSEDALESLVEQRIAQLAEISQKRNTLLREMYRMMRKRSNVWATVTIDDEDEDDLHVFLKEHDLEEHPDTGFISQLSENDLFNLVPPLESHLSTPPESADEARRSQSQSPLSGRDIVESTPVISAQVTAAEGSDSEDELDIIQPSSSPMLSKTGAVSITDYNQNVSTGTSTELSGTPHEEFAHQDTLHTSNTDAEDQNHDHSMERESVMVDVMDVDKPAVLPTSFNSSSARDHSLPNQPQVDVDSLEMDIDSESSRIVNDLDGTGNSHVTRPTSDLSTLFRSTPLESPSYSRHFARRDDGTPEPFINDTGLPSSSPVFIPIPSTSFHGSDGAFNFSTVSLDPPPSPPVSPAQMRHQLNFHYTLPPLDTLPADFRTKNKKVKQKKKDKERDKGDGKKDREAKDDWVPWGLNRWNATIRTNPVYKRVARATKCLSTRDWTVAMTELKVIRAVDRVELLKQGRWSFRQPKKQRTSGGITKTHWDYLMDEMKWMRTDFREERKWKMALAYNLSTSVLEWHAAGTQEKRLKRGICVHWKPPRQHATKDHVIEDAADPSTDPLGMETPTPSGPTRPSSALLNLDYGSDDEDDDDQERDADDALDTPAVIEDSLIDMNSNTYGDNIGFKDLQPKTEEIEDNSLLQSEGMDVDQPAPSELEAATQSEHDARAEQTSDTALKSTSDDPMLLSMSMSTSFSSERSSIPQSKSSKINLYAPLRERIAHSDIDKLFLDFDDFSITTTDPSSENAIESLLPPSDLSDVFPDFQPYTMFGLAASTPPPVDGKKKSEKKSDRDDPVNKRVDEVAYSKVYPASTFMFTKPTLVGALQPSKHLREGRWVDLDQSPISIEYEAPQPFRLPEEFNQGIFEHKVAPIAITTPAVQSVPANASISSPVAKFKEPPKRAIEHLWSASDDLLLKSLAEKYPNNWALVSECYNASRVTIKLDWRTPKDCQERWRERWSPAATQRLLETEITPLEGTPPPGTPSFANIGSSRGVKRLASNSISAATAPTISTGSGSEPKKRRRHAMVQDAVRRSIKKRNETAQKNNVRKSTTMHESHNEISNLNKMSPSEISRRKAERDLLQAQELQAARNRTLAGPNGVGPRPSNGQQPAGGQPGGGNNGQRASVSGVPAPVAQIRSQQVPISQQQRAATPLVAGNSRMSPQQQMLAQQVQRAQSALQGNPTQAVTQAQAQAQVQAQLAFSHALAQAQAAHVAQGHSTIDAQTAAAIRGNIQQALAQNGVNGNAQLSPPYTSRDATSSPAHASPPRSTGTPSNGAVNSPRPASAQAHGQSQSQGATQSQVGMLQNGQLAALNIPQARNVQGHYYLPNVSSSYTPEQFQQNMMRLV